MRAVAIRRVVVRVLVLGTVLLGLVPARSAQAAPPADPPSVVVIYSDDQRFDTLWAMPTVQDKLAARGITFSNAFVPNPLCCPSRASLLTGRYSHSNGVWNNVPPYGGFDAFDDSETLATWLQGAGYTTGLFGKYLNRYWSHADYVPPGWDRWVAFPLSGYFDYRLSFDGNVVSYRSDPSDYSTDVLASEVVSFIESTNGPLFAYYAPYAPHAPSTPAPRHEGAFKGVGKWRPESYDEADVLDKPNWVRALKPWDHDKSSTVDSHRRDQLATLLALDEAVGHIVDALRRTGRLSNTMVVFMGDNGYSLGEHRWKGKHAPYEESIRVPAVVRYDPLIASARTDDQLVLNIDVAPTALELAGVDVPDLDGRSLVPLFSDPRESWRSDFLLERLAKPTNRVPSFCGVRGEELKFVVYETGEQELYDLVADPGELRNVVDESAYADTAAAMQARTSELCTSPPPGMTLPF